MHKREKPDRYSIALDLLYLFLCFAALWLYPYTAEAAAVPVTVRIPVTCSGENPSETYTVVMDSETEEQQKPEESALQLKSDEEGSFTIQYTHPGTYRYRIHQEAGSSRKTIYDKTVYEVDLFVTEDGEGKLYAEPVAYTEGSSEKKTEVHFKNKAASTPSKSSRASSVQTGDTSALPVYAELFLLSAALLTAAVKAAGRKRR